MTIRTDRHPIRLARIGGWTAMLISEIGSRLAMARRARRTRRALDELDERMLQDIGLSRGYEGYDQIDEMTGWPRR